MEDKEEIKKKVEKIRRQGSLTADEEAERKKAEREERRRQRQLAREKLLAKKGESPTPVNHNPSDGNNDQQPPIGDEAAKHAHAGEEQEARAREREREEQEQEKRRLEAEERANREERERREREEKEKAEREQRQKEAEEEKQRREEHQRQAAELQRQREESEAKQREEQQKLIHKHREEQEQRRKAIKEQQEREAAAATKQREDALRKEIKDTAQQIEQYKQLHAEETQRIAKLGYFRDPSQSPSNSQREHRDNESAHQNPPSSSSPTQSRFSEEEEEYEKRKSEKEEYPLPPRATNLKMGSARLTMKLKIGESKNLNKLLDKQAAEEAEKEKQQQQQQQQATAAADEGNNSSKVQFEEKQEDQTGAGWAGIPKSPANSRSNRKLISSFRGASTSAPLSSTTTTAPNHTSAEVPNGSHSENSNNNNEHSDITNNELKKSKKEGKELKAKLKEEEKKKKQEEKEKKKVEKEKEKELKKKEKEAAKKKKSLENAKVFGSPLEEVMELQSDTHPTEDIPLVLKTLTRAIFDLNGNETEGIFRIPGDHEEVERLKAQFDRREYNVDTRDPHTAAACLKLWFRELPTPLIPDELYDECIRCASKPEEIVRVVDKTPPINQRVIKFVVDFLADLSKPEHASRTMMNADNLAMVFAPGFLRCRDPAKMMLNSTYEGVFVRHLIEHGRGL